MKRALQLLLASVTIVLLIAVPTGGHAQGRFNRTITFDGHPIIPPGSDIGVTYYYEDSMTFTPLNPGDQFVRAGGGREAFPDNGTAYVLQGAFDSLAGSRGGVSRFGLYSVDLAEFSTLYAFPRNVRIIGYRPDGTTVTAEFTTDGIIDGPGSLPDFQRFYFGEAFSNLVRFELPGHTYAMDNLVFFDIIPEPSVSALLLLGGIGLWVLRARRARLTFRCTGPGAAGSVCCNGDVAGGCSRPVSFGVIFEGARDDDEHLINRARHCVPHGPLEWTRRHGLAAPEGLFGRSRPGRHLSLNQC